MDGIVSPLDEKHEDMVRELWSGLEREFGLRGVYPARIVHFSYHVVEAYDVESLIPILARFSQTHHPLQVRTTGLGIFTGPQPVVFIPVVRTPDLTLLHQALWLEVAGTSVGAAELYHPDRWVPHITLAHGDIQSGILPDVVRHLGTHTYNWEFTADHLLLLIHAGMPDEQRIRFDLGPNGHPQSIA